MAAFGQYTAEEVCDFLKERVPSLSRNVLDLILEHKIDGEVFLELNDDYLREICPLVGDRLKIKKVIASATSWYSKVYN